MQHDLRLTPARLLRFGGFLLILLLSACSSIRRDGPPAGSVDVSHVPNAVPKVEPLSRYGNLPVYTVNGQIYHVKSSSRNYEERGIASWYGTKFDSQPTSSGEIYDMLGMTAAHKTLPLPTYAQVTNLNNGKSVIVKINDRGPFAPGRIIDLSYAAAIKLGMTGRGTAYVDVKAIDPVQYTLQKRESYFRHAPIFTARNETGEKLFVQAGTFRNRAFAERLKNRLDQVVQSPVLVTPSRGNRLLYRVEIGPLVSPAAASIIRRQLKTAGINQTNLIRHRTEV